MASIYREPGGRRAIQFGGGRVKRQTIRLGKVSQRIAEGIKHRVEQLVAAKRSGHAVDPDTADWLATIEDDLAAKLTRVGLIPKRQTAALGKFLDDYIKGRGDVKPSTATVYGHTKRCLLDYFGKDKLLRDISPGDADKWRLWLINDQELASNTVRRRCGIAKQFLRAAVREHLVARNPFADLVGAVHANTSRYYFLSRQDAQKVLDACPDAEWRLIFALSRYGGLRCPSEHLGLRWSDIDWAAGKMHVSSPKTEHHVGGDSRFVPLFPELLPYLEAVRDEANPGIDCPFSTPIITRYRAASVNLRTHLLRIIKRAGLKPWPKLFQNLRSTRETELAEEYPLHVVCAWIGNSQPVAAKHYLQVTDEHFAQAAGRVDGYCGSAAPSAESVTNDGESEALQNPRQQAYASACSDSSGELVGVGISEESCNSWGERIYRVGDEGLEPPTSAV